jgi:hypothetical protein
MKHLLVLASLACALSSTAVAGSAKPPMLSIRYGSVSPAPTKTVEVTSSGAWAVKLFDASGSLVSVSRGHLDRKVYEQVRAAVIAAPWTITQSSIACFAYSPSYTQYSIQGKAMFTDQMCSGATADAMTLASIATIESALASVAR